MLVAIALLAYKIWYDIRHKKSNESENSNVNELIEKELQHNQEIFGEKMNTFDEKLNSRFQPLDKHFTNLNEKVGQLSEKSEKNQGVFNEKMESMTSRLKTSIDEQHRLNSILGNFSKRGNWGEKMAEDVLKSVGFILNINYFAQKEISNPNDPSRSLKPDYTFPLPEEMELFMDVKFPFDNYQKALELENEVQQMEVRGVDNLSIDEKRNEAKRAISEFIKNVKTQISSLKAKGYVEAENSADQMLMFIPNESIFRFLVEKDPGIMDYGLKCDVTLCSPVTLLSILGIIRESVRIARLRESSGQVLKELKTFMTEWEKFKDAMKKVSDRLDGAKSAFETLSGTRTNVLERPIKKLQRLQSGSKEANNFPEEDIIEIEPLSDLSDSDLFNSK